MVTGGAQGIGFGIVRRLVEAGADVLVADLNGPLAEEKAASLTGPGRAIGMGADVTDFGTGAAVVAAAVEAFGSVDILVNNAGIYPQVPMLDMTGKIVNIASIDGLHPSMVGLAAYDASKGGVVMFTRNFALELAPHKINVNAIAPGGIATEGTAAPLEGTGMTQAEMDAFMEGYIKAKIPMGRMGEPDDIATAAVFLASSAANFMTGEIVVVDGGTLLT